MTKKHLPPPFAPIRGKNSAAQPKPQNSAAKMFAPPPFAPLRGQGTVTQPKAYGDPSRIVAPPVQQWNPQRSASQQHAVIMAKKIHQQPFTPINPVINTPAQHHHKKMTVQMMKRSLSAPDLSEETFRKKILVDEIQESSDDKFGFQHSTIYKQTVVHLQGRMDEKIDSVNKIKGESLEQYTRRSLNMTGFYVVDLNTIKNNSAGLDLIAFKGDVIKLIQCKNFTGTQMRTSESTLLRNFLKELHGDGEGGKIYRTKLLRECIANIVADRFAKEVTDLNNKIEDLVNKYQQNVDVVLPDGLANRDDEDDSYQFIDRSMVMSVTGLSMLQTGHRKRILGKRRNKKTDVNYFDAYKNFMEKRDIGTSNVKYIRKLDDDDDYEGESDYSSGGE